MGNKPRKEVILDNPFSEKEVIAVRVVFDQFCELTKVQSNSDNEAFKTINGSAPLNVRNVSITLKKYFSSYKNFGDKLYKWMLRNKELIKKEDQKKCSKTQQICFNVFLQSSKFYLF
jgi:hypothetical protein